MREIKFRVLYKPNNQVYYQLNESPCFGKFEGDNAVSIEDVFFYAKDDFEIMQYTGLKDKNGQEIYEGDILLSHHGQKGEVQYYSDGYLVHWKKEDYDSVLRIAISDSKAIGNIHENPELLEAIK